MSHGVLILSKVGIFIGAGETKRSSLIPLAFDAAFLCPVAEPSHIEGVKAYVVDGGHIRNNARNLNDSYPF